MTTSSLAQSCVRRTRDVNLHLSCLSPPWPFQQDAPKSPSTSAPSQELCWGSRMLPRHLGDTQTPAGAEQRRKQTHHIPPCEHPEPLDTSTDQKREEKSEVTSKIDPWRAGNFLAVFCWWSRTEVLGLWDTSLPLFPQDCSLVSTCDGTKNPDQQKVFFLSSSTSKH